MKLDLTEDEIQDLLVFIDAGLKSIGLKAAKSADHLATKLGSLIVKEQK